jgi:predicted nucleic acid-binding protein
MRSVLVDTGEKRRQRLEEYLRRYTLILPDRDLCRKWAEVSTQVQRSGNVIETADAWIATTALLYNVPLVTHNRSHYVTVQGLTILSEAPV